jgi:hypothetical protein
MEKKLEVMNAKSLIDNPMDNFSISEKKKKLKWRIL